MFWIFKSYLDIAPSNGGRASVTRDKTRTMKTVSFVKVPKLGDVIKVYDKGGYYFGVCNGTHLR
jgi:hypothetical protein